MRRIALILALCAVASPVLANDKARAALLLSEAEAALAGAKDPAARLGALGQAAQAQEAALKALRVDVTELARQRQALDGQMTEQERSLRAVLSALERLERAPEAATLAHPGGAVAAARAGIALAAFAPKLETEAARVRLQLAELTTLHARREAVAASVRGSLSALQALRAEIATLLDRDRQRKQLTPELITRLEEETSLLAESADGLRALSSALPPAPDAIARVPPARRAKGKLIPPVEGVMAKVFSDEFEGLEIEAAAYANVYAPWPGAVRFAGPFAPYDGLVILEPEEGLLFIFGGLGEIRVAVGESVRKGQPLGAMGGPQPDAEEFLIASSEGIAALAQETLYMEVRENGAPVDPTTWFAFETKGDRE